MRLSFITFTVFATVSVLAAPMAEESQDFSLEQAAAFKLIDQFAAMAQMTQDEAIEFLDQYTALQAEGQSTEFLPGLTTAATVVVPCVAKAAAPFIGKGLKKILPKGTHAAIDRITGSDKPLE